MAQLPPLIEHLLRRAGFGVGPAELAAFGHFPAYIYPIAVNTLLNYDPAATDVDSKIGTPGFIGITTRAGGFMPNQVIADARQRWLFRMVHSPAPLQEKMTLFWHHHFATGYTKLVSQVGTVDATRMMASKPTEDAAQAKGQIELLRERALGNFRDLLVDMSKDVAMLYWLDGYLNTAQRPQENFGRELMELFTFGVENYVETDVYAAARVFSGWNLQTFGTRGTPNFYYRFFYNAAAHDTGAKDFSFPVYKDGGKRIQARSSAQGMQDGLDLIDALAFHPETAKRLARRLWTWFVSEVEPPDGEFVNSIADVYLRNNTEIKPVIKAILLSPQFMDPNRFYQRYSWPVELVVRMFKEVGAIGFSVDNAATPLVNMGQVLFDPPDVNGWELGPGWFSTAGMLSRMNFAAALATNQRVALRDASRPFNATPEALIGFVLEHLSMPAPTADVNAALIDYVRAGGTWVGSDTQLLNKTGGLFHLLAGSGEYQVV